MNIGVFGGTFNPPHKTHIDIVKNAINCLKLDRLFVFPCGQPPHKFCAIDKKIRLEMCRLAFENIPNVEVDDFELQQSGKSFTLETLRYLKKKYPCDNLFLVVGSDSLHSFQTWHCPHEIVKLATLAVIKREGESGDFSTLVQKQEREFDCNILQIEGKPSSISSTAIRVCYQYAFDCLEFVESKVDAFIRQHLLYTDFRAITQKLPKYLTTKRLSHTFYTTVKALELKSNCPPDKIFVAATLHDIAKDLPQTQYAEYGFVDDGSLPQPVIHAFLGELVAKKDFHVTDTEILDAIKYHSTAKPDMSELGMLIYTADKLEDSRPYKTQHLIKPTLLETFYATMVEADEWKNKCNGSKYCQLTSQAIEFYKKMIAKQG